MTDDERDDHDRWFKELITTFFEEFILAFFPDIYEHLDFQHITSLQQSAYTDILKGRKETNSFNIHFPFKEVLTFNFFTLQLYNKNWRDYITHLNPLE